MKKRLIGLVAAATALCAPFGAAADEGMWLLPFIERMNIEQMT